MAVVDFVWQPNAEVDLLNAPDRQVASFNESTNVSTAIPLTFTISAAQATDTVITFGLGNVVYSEFRLSSHVRIPHYNYVVAPPTSDGDNVLQQYDVGTLTVIIPAGQTSVTYQLPFGADNQVEEAEYFNLYIASVSGEHTIHASDLRENQEERFSLGSSPPPFNTQAYNSFGFNTFRIVDDDAPNGSNVLTSGNDVYTIAAGSTLPIFAGAGNDTMNGSSGNDLILAHDGADSVFGNGGDDALHGGSGFDSIRGGAGDDAIIGGRDADNLFGDDGNDTIFGEGDVNDPLSGFDNIDGGAGDDTLLGQTGNDIVNGGSGADAVAGGDGNDILFGQSGADIIFGEAGGDLIIGGSGGDILRGGLGGDLYSFGLGDQGDFIMNFNEGGVRDGLDLRPLFDVAGYTGTDPRAAGILSVLQNGADTDIYVFGVFHVRLENIVAAAIDDSYFLFQ